MIDYVEHKLYFSSTSVTLEGAVVKQVTLRQAGGSVAATLPKDVADRLRVAAGDTLFFVETEAGMLLTPYDPNFERAMQIYERGAKEYRNALHELAK